MHLESYHTVRPARVFRFPYWTVAALAAAACFAVVIALRELPLAEKDAKQQALALAGQAAEKKHAAAEASAGAVQPANRIDIQFPKNGGRRQKPDTANAGHTRRISLPPCVVQPTPPPAAAGGGDARPDFRPAAGTRKKRSSNCSPSR